jgi:hypothetical protein
MPKLNISMRLQRKLHNNTLKVTSIAKSKKTQANLMQNKFMIQGPGLPGSPHHERGSPNIKAVQPKKVMMWLNKCMDAIDSMSG